MKTQSQYLDGGGSNTFFPIPAFTISLLPSRPCFLNVSSCRTGAGKLYPARGPAARHTQCDLTYIHVLLELVFHQGSHIHGVLQRGPGVVTREFIFALNRLQEHLRVVFLLFLNVMLWVHETPFTVVPLAIIRLFFALFLILPEGTET